MGNKVPTGINGPAENDSWSSGFEITNSSGTDNKVRTEKE